MEYEKMNRELDSILEEKVDIWKNQLVIERFKCQLLYLNITIGNLERELDKKREVVSKAIDNLDMENIEIC